MPNQLHCLCWQTCALLEPSPDQTARALLEVLERIAVHGATSAIAADIATALRDRMQTDLAMRWVEVALAIETDHIQALTVKASIESNRGDEMTAIATYHQILNIAPMQLQGYHELCRLLKSQRNWNGALAVIDAALAIFPDIAALCAEKSDLLCRLHRQEDALLFLRTLPPTVRDSSCLKSAWVHALNAAGQFERAIGILRAGAHRAVASEELDIPTINQWLTELISSGNSKKQLHNDLAFFAKFWRLDRRYQGLLACYAMLQAWLDGNVDTVMEIAGQHTDFESLPDIDADRAMRVFYRYVLQLAQTSTPCASLPVPLVTLNVIGESHCLSPANSVFDWHGQLVQARARFVMGVQMHHLAKLGENAYKQRLLSHLNDIDNGPLLLTIGEIDCRPVEGMWKAAVRTNTALNDLMDLTVSGYFSFLDKVLPGRKFSSITIQGIPAPGYDLTDRRNPGDKQGFITMIRRANSLLKAGARSRQWHFLDIHAATTKRDGLGNGLWHLDRYHLSPAFYQHAMKSMTVNTTAEARRQVPDEM
ncbi:hypothetical protein [Janthinobacterium aquaticum]|uniref:hypothetical protein n=1 Tax=Janthinobacterium sp. FT58W TaxID=2654254 RepID=UPI00126402E0|nr:hypothetical protein [Janthinobacterium sp. FT58W]KAB8044479.1 hypothetical protein GCM43_04560 [Janthinobacterium sp. FT58W]